MTLFMLVDYADLIYMAPTKETPRHIAEENLQVGVQ